MTRIEKLRQAVQLSAETGIEFERCRVILIKEKYKYGAARAYIASEIQDRIVCEQVSGATRPQSMERKEGI